MTVPQNQLYYLFYMKIIIYIKIKKKYKRTNVVHYFEKSELRGLMRRRKRKKLYKLE